MAAVVAAVVEGMLDFNGKTVAMGGHNLSDSTLHPRCAMSRGAHSRGNTEGRALASPAAHSSAASSVDAAAAVE